MNKYDVIGLGVPCVDLLVNVDYMPTNNEVVKMNQYSWQGGGKVPTAIVALSKLGSKVGFVGKTGDDSFGKFISKDFTRYDVDTSNLIIDEGSNSSFSLVISDKTTDSRNIIYNPGNVETLSLEEVDLNYIFSSKIIHVSGSTSIDHEIVKMAKNKGIKISIDADHYNEDIVELIPWVDYFIASKMFIDDFNNYSIEKNLKVISDMGPELVVVTLGKDGCVSYYKNEVKYYDGYEVEVIDTTGAGDVFHGAFLYALLEEMKIEDCCKFANAVSAIKCTNIGGRAGIPRKDEVDFFLKNGEINLTGTKHLLETYKNIEF